MRDGSQIKPPEQTDVIVAYLGSCELCFRD